jgi:hypothetical protein
VAVQVEETQKRKIAMESVIAIVEETQTQIAVGAVEAMMLLEEEGISFFSRLCQYDFKHYKE